MTYDLDDTIAAIASPPGGGARGIVRLSGPHVVACVARVFRPNGDSELVDEPSAVCVPGTAVFTIHDASSEAKLPAELFLWPTDRSYTRQPVAELHTLGSPPLIAALLQTVCRFGARLAEPGEFTLRAFLAGRLDLAQAEAVLGVIGALGPNDLESALVQLAGGLSGPLHAIREDLIGVLAELEAGLDFADEDIEFIAAAELAQRLRACEAVVAATLKQMTHREDRPVEFRVALVGPPNAGKSSLFNALVRRYGRAGTSPALVSAQPGTTRDYLVARLDVGGCQFELVDTAGTQEAPDGLSTLERAFDRAAREQGHAVDLQLECMDAAAIAPLPTPADPNRWPVITKADLVDRQTLKQFSQQVQAVGVTSAETGEGFELLLRRIAEAASQTPHARGTAVAATASRCRASLMAAAECLGRARQLSAGRHAEEIVAVEVREALDKIGQVVGAVYTDDILDRIFSQFCIGK